MSKVKPVAQPNQRQCDDVMSHQFFEIFSRLFQHQEQHNHLLSPVTRLYEIVCFEYAFMYLMRESFIHSFGVEVPDRSSAHDIQPKRPEYDKIHGCICLFHETSLLSA